MFHKILPVYIRDRIARIKATTYLSKRDRHEMIRKVLAEYEKSHAKGPE